MAIKEANGEDLRVRHEYSLVQYMKIYSNMCDYALKLTMDSCRGSISCVRLNFGSAFTWCAAHGMTNKQAFSTKYHRLRVRKW